MKKLRPLLLAMLLSSLATFSQNKKTNYSSISLVADFSSNVFFVDIKQPTYFRNKALMHLQNMKISR